MISGAGSDCGAVLSGPHDDPGETEAAKLEGIATLEAEQDNWVAWREAAISLGLPDAVVAGMLAVSPNRDAWSEAGQDDPRFVCLLAYGANPSMLCQPGILTSVHRLGSDDARIYRAFLREYRADLSATVEPAHAPPSTPFDPLPWIDVSIRVYVEAYVRHGPGALGKVMANLPVELATEVGRPMGKRRGLLLFR